MGTLAVYGGELLTPFEVIEDGAVLARDGIIEKVGPRREVVTGPAGVEVDVAGRLICPGFVDLQVNGGGGALLSEQPAPEALERIARAHIRFGTTSLLAAVVTADEARMARALEVVKAGTSRPAAGARVLGAHLEGPFINPSRRGAHLERFVQSPRRDLLERLLAAAGGSLRLLTLAPELTGALELIAAARAASVAVAIGHTDATYEEAERAVEAGASLGTHLFNAMRPFGHRDPGVVGALLQDERVAASVIADGVHVHPAALALAARAKGPEGVALITDAMSPVGTDMVSFTAGDREVRVRSGACYLENGTLAGSVLSMSRAVWLMHTLANVPVRQCVQMATATPARVLGLEGEIGVLKPGARADIAVCDRELQVWKVYVGGELAYDAEG